MKRNIKRKIGAALIGAAFLFSLAEGEVIDMTKYDISEIVNKNCNDISSLKKAVAKLIVEMEKERGKWKNRLEKKADVIKKKRQGNCTVVTKVYIDKEQIKYSYQKYPEPKRFTVATKKAYIYNYPALYGTKIIGEMHRGDVFEADMFTYPGWVHAKGKGWLRGFKLFPKVLYDEKKVDKDKRKSAYVYVKEKVCDGITVKKDGK